MPIPSFHLAFPVTELVETEAFYTEVLGCRVGRRSDRWIDFDFFGHQITAHLATEREACEPTNQVDGKAVPVRHFGMILPWGDWESLADKLRDAGTEFLIEPHVRFSGETGEQATLFVRDPSGNGLEFKSFRNPESIFAR